MKNRIQEFQIDDNCTSWIEVPESDEAYPGMRHTSEKDTDLEIPKLDKALALIQAFARRSGAALSTLKEDSRPDEMSMSLSLAFNAKAGGWGFAEVSAGTTIGVVIAWKNMRRSA
jgi:hypothetical protein